MTDRNLPFDEHLTRPLVRTQVRIYTETLAATISTSHQITYLTL